MMSMKALGAALVLASGAVALPGCVSEDEAQPVEQETSRGGDVRTGEYDAVPNWWKPAPDHDENWTWGS